MVLHLGHVVWNELVRQLVETQVLASYPLRYVAVVGYISFAISCVMIGGAVLASAGSDGTRRWWFAGAAIALALETSMNLAPWLLSKIGIDVGLGTYQWIIAVGLFLYLAAVASIAIVAHDGQGNRRLATAALWLVGLRAVLFLIARFSADGRTHDGMLPNIDMLSAFAVWLVTLAVALDLLGAFPRVERTPAARTGDRSTAVASAIAIGLAMIGIAMATLALWATKRMTSATPHTSTFIRGALVFFAAAMMLSRLQGRAIHAGLFAAAFVATLIAGRLVLHSYERSATEVALETHELPGVSIRLPRGTIDVEYTHVDHGKLTISPHHPELGMVELSWDRWDRDPIETYESVSLSYPVVPITDRAGNTPVHGIEVSMINSSHLYESWQCPGDDRWFLLSISRSVRDTDAITKLGARITATLQCR